MIHKKSLVGVAVILLLAVPLVTFAETIVLKSGKTVEGQIIERTGEYVKIDFLGVSLTYFLDEIESIDGKNVNLFIEQSNTELGNKKTKKYIKNKEDKINITTQEDLYEMSSTEKKVKEQSVANVGVNKKIYSIECDAIKTFKDFIKEKNVATNSDEYLKVFKKYATKEYFEGNTNTNVKVFFSMRNFQYNFDAEKLDFTVAECSENKAALNYNLSLNDDLKFSTSRSGDCNLNGKAALIRENGIWKISNFSYYLSIGCFSYLRPTEPPRYIPDAATAIKIAESDIKTLALALNLYKKDNGNYPTIEQGLNALLSKPNIGPIPKNWNGPYLTKEPVDSWGKSYKYVCPGVHNKNSYDLSSYGPDGRKSRDDIANW